MRSLISLRTSLQLCLVAAVAPATFARAANLLSNPGFENGTDGWRLFIPEEEKQKDITFSIASDAPHEGSSCVRLEAADFARYSLSSKKNVDVQPGEHYRLSAWLKGERLEIMPGTPGVIFRITALDQGGMSEQNLFMAASGEMSSFGRLDSQVDVPADWTKVEGVFEIPEEASVLKVEVFSWTVKGAILLDDISLEPVDKSIALTPGGDGFLKKK